MSETGTLQSRYKDVLVITAVSGVTTLNVFIQGALTVALTTIGNDLHLKQADLQWPLNVYALSYACSLLFFGRLGDIVGGRLMFMLGSTWFTIWSIATAFAPNGVAFIIFIAMNGLGAAANTPAGIGILSQHFELGPRRNQALGILGAGQPIGYILGLVLGGLLTQTRATWRAVFYFQAGLGALFVFLGWVSFEKDSEASRYKKGLDWGGALLSAAGLGTLTYSLADSTTAAKGWATPQIPSLLSVSVVVLACFIYYEKWRESKHLSVLVPLSMWRQPGGKMGAIMLLAFCVWWSFNTVFYLMTLYFQQVKLYGPIETTLHFIPSVIAGFFVNVVTGAVMSRVPGLYIVLVGISGVVIAPLLFALMDVSLSYWKMSFFIMITSVMADAVYPVGNLQVCLSLDTDSQSLAGGVFSVATRIGSSIGLAVCSSMANAISEKYQKHHPELAATSPEVLMVGFRAAAWMCVAVASLAVVIALVRLRDVGIVGGKRIAEDAEQKRQSGRDDEHKQVIPVEDEPIESVDLQHHDGLVEIQRNQV